MALACPLRIAAGVTPGRRAPLHLFAGTDLAPLLIREEGRPMAKKSSGDHDPERARPRPMRARSLDKVRRDLERERERAIGALRELGLVPNREEGEPDDVGRPVLDQGDVARANERQEMSVATREP